MQKTTCQICEREIKANTGVIAHHGYQRPNRGSGWQTASCIGARGLPYEVSCDLLPDAIQRVKDYIKSWQERLREHRANPPATLTMYRHHSLPTIVVERPADFDPTTNADSYRSGIAGTYECEYNSIVRTAHREIEWAKQDQERLERRLANWKPQITNKGETSYGL